MTLHDDLERETHNLCAHCDLNYLSLTARSSRDQQKPGQITNEHRISKNTELRQNLFHVQKKDASLRCNGTAPTGVLGSAAAPEPPQGRRPTLVASRCCCDCSATAVHVCSEG